ncbi:MAG: hypothetical protein WD939_04910 [Dehalococcoidia bacterium]
MSEQLDLGMDGLLRQGAPSFAYPPTPAIADAVVARVRAEQPRGLAGVFDWLRGPALRPALAALAVVAVIVGSLLAVEQSRTAIAEFFGVGGVKVDRTPLAGPTPLALSPDSFAEPATIGEVQARVGFPLRFYMEGGAPANIDRVYLGDTNSTAPYAIFVYPEFDLYQREFGFFGKGGLDPSLIQDIGFDGTPAIWIEQGGHIAESYDAQGRLLVESRRSVDRATLLWERDGVTLRLETGLSQEEAIDVARSIR